MSGPFSAAEDEQMQQVQVEITSSNQWPLVNEDSNDEQEQPVKQQSEEVQAEQRINFDGGE